MKKNIAIIGASGGIGASILKQAEKYANGGNIYALSRSGDEHIHIDFEDEASIKQASEEINDELHIIINATGLLHNDDVQPEKSMRDLSYDNMEKIFRINAFAPALIAKYFLPKTPRKEKFIYASFSARVGSISDNRLGGWHSYRASKTALNMLLKNISLEVGRINKEAIIIGLHPGTVDTELSKPFQTYVKEGKLFTPEFSAEKLWEVINNATPALTGKVLDWDNKIIAP